MILAAMIGMVTVIGCAGPGARAADDEEPELLDTKIFRGILKGLGLRKDGEGSGIEYRERSPLVLPTSKDLPQPEADAPVRKAAGWPDDADIKRDRLRRETERKRKAYEPGVDDKPLMPNQVGPTTKVGSKAGEAPGRTAEDIDSPSSPKELGVKSLKDMFTTGYWAPKEEYVPFTGEPQRSSLTEPPSGYRTPSPAQPYGVGREKWVAPKVDRNEPVR
jgi:hypothetical protein